MFQGKQCETGSAWSNVKIMKTICSLWERVMRWVCSVDCRWKSIPVDPHLGDSISFVGCGSVRGRGYLPKPEFQCEVRQYISAGQFGTSSPHTDLPLHTFIEQWNVLPSRSLLYADGYTYVWRGCKNNKENVIRQHTSLYYVNLRQIKLNICRRHENLHLTLTSSYLFFSSYLCIFLHSPIFRLYFFCPCIYSCSKYI